ncbi:hypothetical protein M407DRAFT_28364 [Tulasnella calospora MUT 4182]|uniref:Uncharacterized protein n=1 Tax=Tulasnella calospora MUT 4182 TaxID=1051891 RepID=A0A0C3QC57_9AGAM|nr:hypothetical protein M407DRAFT_28364 [Tulasnella calospora MUT 4182]
MPKDHTPREKAKRKRFDETRRAPRLTRQRAARNPSNSTDKCWFDVTMDNIKDVVDDVLSQGKDIRIITAESAYCSICHSDLSKANIDAPNGLLGHCRRVKKCLGAKERRNIVTLGLKMRKAKTSSNAKGHPSFWDSVDSLRMMDEVDFPLKAYYLDRVMPEQPPLELESESPFRTSARTNRPNIDESSGHYSQTGESEIFDVEEDESQQIDDDDEESYEAIQLSPEAQGPSTYIFPPTCYDQQIPGSAATRQQSVVNTPMGTVEPSPCITTSADLSPYSSGAVEREFFVSQPYPQSYASPFLVPESGGHALTATAVGSIVYPPRSPPNAHHIQGTMHSHISSPATSTPGNTPARPVTEGELYIPEVLIPNTTSSIRRANSNPPLTMTHSLPLPFHVSPPLNLPNKYAVLSDKSDGHNRSFFSNYRGSAGMMYPAALSGQGQSYNGHLQTGAEGYAYRNPPLNITIGGCMPTSDTPSEQQGHLHSVPLYPSLPPSPPLPVAPPIAIPSTRTPASHPPVSSLHHQSQGHAAPVVQAMHSLHQSPPRLYRAALGRQLAGRNYPQSSLSYNYSMLAPSWDDNGGVVPNFRGLGMWMDAEQHRKSGADSPNSAKNWAVPSARDLPGGFGLQALPKSNGIPTDPPVQQLSSAGPRTPLQLFALKLAQTNIR